MIDEGNNTAKVKEIDQLKEKISQGQLPKELEEKALSLAERLKTSLVFGGFLAEYDNIAAYIDWITSLPWQTKTEDSLDLVKTKKVLDSHHYGLGEIKDRVLEYLAVMKLKKDQGQIARAPILCLVGLVGTGKTTLASSIAESMGRKMIRIPFGGIERPFYLRGQSRSLPQAEPGQIIKGLRQSEVKNPIILLDEIDRIGEESRSAIMGVLLGLLDPEQNSAFLDYYLDYPFDLSESFFIATCNNTANISQAVLDRLEIITMPSYSDQEKIIIAQKYLLPRSLKDAGLEEGQLVIDDGLWSKIVRPLGYDAGVRTLKRNIDGICRQVAKQVVLGQAKQISLDETNISQYLSSW
ncbi:MAG: AAA family ATPase [Candidatus Shapirobacteria bacterium]|nr:AAA family ATPase [Candidatus Shapirobacteria bacterium]MDD5481446.1 AAA family ATPase [Candidatus Shapirobacteria bacterium]